MLTVACVQWGNYEGRGAEYVERLARMVRRHLRMPHRIVCLTDDQRTAPLEVEPFDCPVKGWWNKLSLFRAGLFPAGERILYFDLDTLIVGDLDRLARYDGRLGTLGSFRYPHERLASAVMAWRAGSCDWIWDRWVEAGKPVHPGGDDHWLHDQAAGEAERLQRRFPGLIASYKFDHCQDGPPEGAAVVCFQRKPKPHEIGGWVKEAWG